MGPLPYTEVRPGAAGRPAPIRRTRSFSFRPGGLPPVNKIVGHPRLYG
jgi:hypothetical protein